VTKNGKINGACDGKLMWDNELQGLAPCLLNMAVVKISEYNPINMEEFHHQMDENFIMRNCVPKPH
jgi:hypothetical protein